MEGAGGKVTRIVKQVDKDQELFRDINVDEVFVKVGMLKMPITEKERNSMMSNYTPEPKIKIEDEDEYKSDIDDSHDDLEQKENKEKNKTKNSREIKYE